MLFTSCRLVNVNTSDLWSRFHTQAVVWGHMFIWAGVIYNESLPWGTKQKKKKTRKKKKKPSAHANTEWSSDSRALPEDGSDSLSLSIILRHSALHVRVLVGDVHATCAVKKKSSICNHEDFLNERIKRRNSSFSQSVRALCRYLARRKRTA